MPGPWEDFAPTAGPWNDFKSADTTPVQSQIGIRAATPWESVKDRVQEFLHNPIATLRAPIPGTEEYGGRGDTISQFALGGIAPGGAALREFAALPKSKGFAKVTEFPGKVAQAYTNAKRASTAASALRVAQAGQAEHAASRFAPPPAPTYIDPVPEMPRPSSPITQGPMRGPDWWEAYQQELRSQPPPQEPYYPPPPEPTYIEPPSPPASVSTPVGPRLPEGWEPSIPDYMKPGAETAEQMAARHEAEAAAANTSQARTMSGDDIISMDLHGKPYAKLTPGQRDDVALYKKIVPQAPATPAVPASAPSLDRLTAQVTGGANKKFAQASEAVKKEVQSAAPPVVAPPPGMPAEPPAPSVIPRYASTELQPNSQFPPVEHMPSRYRAPNGEVSVSERIAHKKDVQIAEYLMSPESGVKIETPEDWNRLPLSEKNRIAGEAYIKYGGNPKFVQKGTTNFGANYRPGQQRSISGRSADVGIDHVYQTLKELMVPPPPQ